MNNTIVEYRRNRRGEFVAGYGHTLRSALIVAIACVLVYSIAYIAQRVGPIMPVEEAQASELLKDCVKDEQGMLQCDFTPKSMRESMSKYVIMHTVPEVVTSTSTDAVTVEAKIRRIAFEEGYNDVEFLVALAKCESRMSATALNARGNYPVGSIDVGVFQINSFWNKHITTNQALDVDFATRWTIKKLKAGGKHLWMCTKMIEK